MMTTEKITYNINTENIYKPQISLRNVDSYRSFKFKVESYECKYGLNNLMAIPLDENEKKPLINGWTKDKNQNEINEKIKSLEKVNLRKMGFITGEKTGLVVIDIDNKDEKGMKNGMKVWDDFISSIDNKKRKEVDKILTIKTPSGGLHLYFRYDDKLKHWKNKAPAFAYDDGTKMQIDIRTTNGFIVAPNCIYKSKTTGLDCEYEIYIDGKIDVMPEWMFEIFNKYYMNVEKPKETKNAKTNTTNTETAKSASIDDDKARDLLSLLSENRFRGFDNWSKLAFACHNAGISYIVFDEFCRKYGGYDEIKNKTFWDNIKTDETKEHFTIKSIYYWAKLDSPENFYDFKNNYLEVSKSYIDAFNMCKDHTDDGISQMIYEILKNDFVFCENKWYVFNYSNNNKWVSSSIKNVGVIKNSITKFIVPELQIYTKVLDRDLIIRNIPEIYKVFSKKELIDLADTYTDYMKKKLGPPFWMHFSDGVKILKLIQVAKPLDTIIQNEKKKTKYKKFKANERDEKASVSVLIELESFLFSMTKEELYMKKIFFLDIIYSLRTNNTLNAICNINFGRYEKPEFEKQLDNQRHLIGFENGVYDFQKKQFRQMESSDYITYSTNFNYSENVDKEAYNHLMQIFTDIHDEIDLRDYTLKSLASCFNGKNVYSLFHIWTGCGANGKSLICDAMSNMLGDYADKLASSHFTHKTDQSPEHHTESLNKIMKKRFVYSSEPKKGAYLNLDFIKEITGKEDYTTRGHQGKQQKTLPFFNIFMCCNDLPKTETACDLSIRRRFRVMPYKNTFVSNPNKDNKNEKQLDASLGDKLQEERYKNALFHILLKYYNELDVKTEPKAPEGVEVFTDRYLLSDINKVLSDWINRRLEKTKNEDDMLCFDNIIFDLKETILEKCKDKMAQKETFEKVIMSRKYTDKSFKEMITNFNDKKKPERKQIDNNRTFFWVGLKFRDPQDEVD